MKKYKIIALIGESGSGKDTILKKVIQKDYHHYFHEIISCTTRPPRDGEIDGENYYFLSKDHFLKQKENNMMLETSFFNNWYYGTSLNNLNPKKINLGVFNPEGIRNLLARNDIDLIVFKVKCDSKIRLLRQLNRESNPDVDEIVRRYNADKKDFSNLNFRYIELDNNNSEDLEEFQHIIKTARLFI